MTYSDVYPVETVVVGTGYGLRVAAPTYQRQPSCRLVSVVGADEDRTRDRLRAARMDSHLATGLNDVVRRGHLGLVHVASPNEFHEQQIRQLVEHPTALLLEKPLALNEEKQRELGGLLLQRSGKVFVNFPLRAMGTVDFAAVDGSDLAAVVMLTSPFDRRYTGVDTWKTREEEGGGVHHMLLPHLCDYVLQLVRRAEGRLEKITLILETDHPETSEQLMVSVGGPYSEPVTISTRTMIRPMHDTFAALFELSMDRLVHSIVGRSHLDPRGASKGVEPLGPAGIVDVLAAYRLIRTLEQSGSGPHNYHLQWHLGRDDIAEISSWLDELLPTASAYLDYSGVTHG